jgi:hypothetical protein
LAWFWGLLLCLLVLAGVAEAQVVPSGIGYPFGFESPLSIGDIYEGYEEPREAKGIRLGPFIFRPGVQVNTAYTDNANYTNTNKKSDFIFSIDPSFSFTLAKGLKLKDYISFGYNGDLGAYLHTGNNDYTTHNLWADINLLQRPRTYMRLRESLTYTDNPYGSQEYVGQGVTNSRTLNATDFVIGYNLPHDSAVELGYLNLWENYFQAAYEDYSSFANILKPTVLYSITGKTQVLAQYNIGFRHYYEQPSEFSSDYSVQETMAGIRITPSARLSGEVKFGYAWRRFVNDVNEIGVPYNNSSVPVYSANLAYAVSPKTIVNFSAYRQFLVSSDFNPVFAVRQDSYTRNAFGLTFNTRLRKNLVVTLAGAYYLDQYQDSPFYPGHTDQYYNMGIWVRHQFMRYLWGGLGYNFQKRDSQVTYYNSYTQNNIIASVIITY